MFTTNGPLPVAPASAATIDPTVLANGIWVIAVVCVDSTNSPGRAETSVIVDGQLKLGRYRITYQDLNVPVSGIPIQVRRTYDTLDRLKIGDFGFGWSLEVANFRVSVNKPLGQGGWEQYDCGVALFIVTKCMKANKSHYVTVTWPTGRTETFDLTPAKSPPAFNFLTQAGYAARPNTTSKLSPAPGDEFAMFIDNANNDSSLYVPFGDQPYDPQRFLLTAKDGTRYLLDRDEGLIEATDRNNNNNKITVTDDGIISSAGPSITFTRDDQDRISKITDPAGNDLVYAYDSNGDLASAADRIRTATRRGSTTNRATKMDDPVRVCSARTTTPTMAA